MKKPQDKVSLREIPELCKLLWPTSTGVQHHIKYLIAWFGSWRTPSKGEWFWSMSPHNEQLKFADKNHKTLLK